MALDTLQIGMHMEYSWKYKTPEGFDDLVMCGDDEALTGLWFEGSRDDRREAGGCEKRETPVFRDTHRWLDEYFAGRDPGFTPNYRIEGLTPFRQAVIDEMPSSCLKASSTSALFISSNSPCSWRVCWRREGHLCVLAWDASSLRRIGVPMEATDSFSPILDR